jgi:hypothetical protein
MASLGGLLSLYLVGAYVVTPAAWRLNTRNLPAVEDGPRITHTRAHIHGDPLNLALAGSREDVVRAMLGAGWRPADPITFKTSLHIAASTVLHLPYPDAPVSNLYLFKRKQDLAFQQPVGRDPRRRHHVRFWLAPQPDEQGRSLWMGAATFDSRVGFSHTTGQITHHIAPDVDCERDKILEDLRQAALLADSFWIDPFHQHTTGYNGGGDRWVTDGRLAVGIIAPAQALAATPP